MPKLAALLRSDWEAELERSGLGFVAPKEPAGSGDGVACPACGTHAPLVEGACSDCGLTLG